MIATTFDTLQASKDLQSHGFDQEQAEAIAQAIRNGQGELVTKSDLENVRVELKSELVEVKTDITWLKWAIGVNLVVIIGGFSLLAKMIS